MKGGGVGCVGRTVAEKPVRTLGSKPGKKEQRKSTSDEE